MDPDPLSIYCYLFPIRIFFIFNLFNSFLLVTSLIAACLLVVLNAFSDTLKTISTEDLKRLEKSEPSIFEKLQSIFNRNESMSTLFSLAKLFITVLFVSSVYALLQNVDLHYLWKILIVVLLLVLCFWLLPKWLSKKDTLNVKMGVSLTSTLLAVFTPVANILAPEEQELPHNDVSLEELQTALPETENTKQPIANLALYKQVLRFDKLLIKNVMRPKKEIVGIKAIYNFQEVLSKMQKSTFSRLPVYDGCWSNILGIIHCKDLLPFTDLNQHDWNQHIRPIVFVKPDDYAQDVLRIFQKSKNHMAIVRDNDNKIAGILTLEDITEEIIGEIEDE